MLFSILNNCFNEQQLNSLEDYMAEGLIEAVREFNLLWQASEFLGFIFEEF